MTRTLIETEANEPNELAVRPYVGRWTHSAFRPFVHRPTWPARRHSPTVSRCRPTSAGALIKLDMPSIVKMGAHPLVPFLGQLQIQRLRPGR